MNSITACSDTGQPIQKLMDSYSASLNHSRHRKTLRKAEGAAFLLALLAHLALWQVYRAIPSIPPVEIPPPPIEVSLVTVKPQAAAPAATQPQSQPTPPRPQVRPPPPKPKPIPKVEKPAPLKLEKPKPKPTQPTHRPEPEAEAAPSPEPEAPPAPPAPPAPSAPTETTTHKPAPKAESGNGNGNAEENSRFSQGTVKGYRITFPPIARERGWTGTVTAKIRVSADGEIEDVSISSSSGHDVLDEHAIDIIKSASQVQPCHRGDKPVACSFTQSIRFTLTRE